jgi:hypothetical protein
VQISLSPNLPSLVSDTHCSKRVFSLQQKFFRPTAFFRYLDLVFEDS